MTPEEFWTIWQSSEPEVPNIFYRLYYNDHGEPLFYTMEDLPGNYIEIDRETFAQSPGNVRVVDGVLKRITTSAIFKLTPSDHGTCCVPGNICIVVTEQQLHQKWSIKRYETN